MLNKASKSRWICRSFNRALKVDEYITCSSCTFMHKKYVQKTWIYKQNLVKPNEGIKKKIPKLFSNYFEHTKKKEEKRA